MTRKLKHNILIVPDVHCRPFWKVPIERLCDDIDAGRMEVVFLGDYLDPYPFEISEDIATGVVSGIKMLKEIINLARTHKNVHLLLGNHDMHYVNDDYADHIYKCRYSTQFAKKIKSLFCDNLDVFQMAWDCKIDKTLVLFTHAGVLKTWVDSVFPKNRIKRPNAALLNNMLATDNVLPFAMVGPARGGWGRSVGSPIWADAGEHVSAWLQEHNPNRRYQEVYKDDIYQVFAHSLSFPGQYPESFDRYEINEHWAMLDARRCFVMNTEGHIEEYK